MLLHNIFEKQAKTTPTALAIKSAGEEFSYKQIDEAANSVANFLTIKGVCNGAFVGIYFKRSQLPIVAMLGVLKAGAVYVPIDRSFPEDRVRHIISDADIKVILTEKELFEELPKEGVELIDISSIEGNPSTCYLSKVDITPDNLTYLIYTSGSTGKPKGVMTTHANVVHFVESFKQVCRLTPADRLYNGFAYSFDGSVEEIWMAFSSGASLIVATDEQAKLSTEAVKLISSEQITFLSTVPTMLRMMSEDMPSLKLIILSGEPCTADLVDIWAEKVRLLNVYGPTETTVNTTYWECRKGVPITIGRPIPNYPIHILDNELKPAIKGELYIGGKGVAKGYLHQEELTSMSFREDIIEGETIYKSGDLVTLSDDGELLFHGRIDSQVKVRGFRIELSEIESVISESEQVESVAVITVNPKMMTELAAYIVLKGNDFDSDELLETLHKRLPIYMVPTYLELIEEMPRLTSGKIDRKALPQNPEQWLISNREIIEPRTETENRLAEIWRKILKPHTLSVTDDFFNDLRGDSLFAAIVATEMRDEGMEIAIRDIYQCRTIEKLAVVVDEMANVESEVKIFTAPTESKESKYSFWVKALQLLSQPLIGAFMLAPLLAWWVIYEVMESYVASIIVSAIIIAYPLLLILSIASKWLIIGRFKAGEYPLYGFYFFRWWLVDKLTHIAMPQLLAGTPLMSLYYKAMGAKVGKGCVIDTHLSSAWDMVEIGNNTSIGNETQIMGATIEHKTLKIGRIHIGDNCFVGIHSCIGINTVMDDNSRLGDISVLQEGERIAGAYQGSPIQKSEVRVPKGEKYNRRNWLWCMMHIASLLGLEIFSAAATLPSIYLILFGFESSSLLFTALMILLSAPLFVFSFAMLAALCSRVLLLGIKEGTYKVDSIFYVRKWLADSIIRISVMVIKPLYTTIYLPGWLRLLGAKIGKRAEISTVSQISPELMEIGDESFFADGSIIGGRTFYNGYMEVSKTRIGSRSFVGNSAILPVGTSIGDGCLIGVLSVPPITSGTIPNGTDWLGSPSFNLPLRQKVEGFSRTEIYEPTLKLYLLRYLIDTLRIVVPAFLEIATVIALYFGVLFLFGRSQWYLIPLVMPALSIVNSLIVIAYKWLLMGRIPSTIKPLWCTFVWRNEALNGAYESVMCGALSGLIGTPYIAPFLRILGCKIGRNVYLGSMLLSEFDLVNIGDDVTINSGVVIQNHLFEDRIMKASSLHIKSGCSVGNMSIVLYDAVIENNTRLDALSLVMKNEKLPSNTLWRGIPCQKI